MGSSNGNGLIERWNGSAWSIVASPAIAGATSVTFSGVSSASATLCVAVGQSHGPSYPNDVALLEQWNGAGWSVVAVPLPEVTYISRLSEVSCPAVTSCFAAGYADASGGRIVVDRWDGTSWSLAPAVTPPDVSFP